MSNPEELGEQGGLSPKQRNALMEGIANLPHLHAKIIVLRYMRDMPMDEIAKTLNLSIIDAEQMHYDALVRLKRWLP